MTQLTLISIKYEVTYSMHIPHTDLTNTFKGFAYTNSDNSKFLKIVEEKITFE